MMEFISNHPKLSMTIAACAILIPAIFLSLSSQNQTAKTINPTTTTKVTSPFMEVTYDQAINSDLNTGDPNTSAVQQPFLLFGLDSLPLTAKQQYSIHEDLLNLLGNAIVPTYATTYVHIDRHTLKCSEFDCTFSFYIDSPEGYYTYHAYHNPDGSEAFTLTQEPLPGVNQ